jgi:hypothetical protein
MATSLANDLHDAALLGEKVTTPKLRECWNLIAELEKHGLDIMMRKIFLDLLRI